MTSITMHTENSQAGTPRFRAVAGNRQSVGRTMGEALDALTADWHDDIQETAVFIQRLQPDAYFTAAQYHRMQELLTRRATLSAAGAHRTGNPHRRGTGRYRRPHREPYASAPAVNRCTLSLPNVRCTVVSTVTRRKLSLTFRLRWNISSHRHTVAPMLSTISRWLATPVISSSRILRRVRTRKAEPRLRCSIRVVTCGSSTLASMKGAAIVGITPVGRATVVRLQMNRARHITARRAG